MLTVPPTLRAGAGRTPEGAAWLARLPGLVADACVRWGLRLDEPFGAGASAWCAPARDADGADLVLKVSYPHEEARFEADALRAWSGRGAVALVDADAGDWVLLLRRVRPGVPLRAVRTPVARRLGEAAELLGTLGAAPAPARVPALHEVAGGWAALVDERAGRAAAAGVRPDPGLVAQASAVLRSPAPARPRLVHGDLNPGNVLRTTADGTRGGPAAWVAIDPKPLAGDPAYDPWPLLEQTGDPWRTAHPRDVLAGRVLLVAERAGLDPVAVASWALARSVEVGLWRWSRSADGRRIARDLARSAAWAAVRDGLAGG